MKLASCCDSFFPFSFVCFRDLGDADYSSGDGRSGPTTVGHGGYVV